jgi:putative transposase
VYQWVARAIAGFFGSRASLVAENLCLRQQLLVLQRRHPRPRLTDADRRFWILASRWFCGWRETLLISRPDTVIGWHRKGWRAYWRWRSRAPANSGRHPIRDEVRLLIRRLASENILWGQRRIQAELARLGFKVSARTVAKYMRLPRDREPSPGEPFLNGTLLRSGPVTSSASRLYGSGPSMPSSWSATPTVKCCMSR